MLCFRRGPGIQRCLVLDGRLDLDTNTVERAIRPIALGRKNALFAGSDRGGEHWAMTLPPLCPRL